MRQHCASLIGFWDESFSLEIQVQESLYKVITSKKRD